MKTISFQVSNEGYRLIELAAANDTQGVLGVAEYAMQCLLDGVFGQPRCRKCGCTEDNCAQCIEKTGDACRCVEADLCSACWTPPRPKKKARAKR